MLGAAKKDMQGNLKNIREGSSGNDSLITMEDIIEEDIKNKTCFRDNKKRDGLSFGILWLLRALRFIMFLLENMDNKHPEFATKETAACSKDAYGKSIKPYHGWVLGGVFGTMMGQVPYRKNFVKNLSNGAPEETFYAEMRQFVDILKPKVESLHQFMIDKDLNDPWKA